MSTVVNSNLVYKLQQQITQQAATISTLCEVIGEYQSWHLPHIEDVGCPLCAKYRAALASIPKEQP